MYDNDFVYQDILNLESAGTQFNDNQFLFYGTQIDQDGGMSGISRTSTGATIGYTTLNGPVPSGQYYGRVGFDLEGRDYVAYSSNGTNWTTFHRHDAAAPNGTYRFYMQSEATGANITSLSVGELTNTIALNYRYIESPDGQFYHPLFASADEAAYVDIQNGGTGTAHAHVFVDEPTASVWYMPDNGGHSRVFLPLLTPQKSPTPRFQLSPTTCMHLLL